MFSVITDKSTNTLLNRGDAKAIGPMRRLAWRKRCWDRIEEEVDVGHPLPRLFFSRTQLMALPEIAFEEEFDHELIQSWIASGRFEGDATIAIAFDSSMVGRTSDFEQTIDDICKVIRWKYPKIIFNQTPILVDTFISKVEVQYKLPRREIYEPTGVNYESLNRYLDILKNGFKYPIYKASDYLTHRVMSDIEDDYIHTYDYIYPEERNEMNDIAQIEILDALRGQLEKLMPIFPVVFTADKGMADKARNYRMATFNANMLVGALEIMNRPKRRKIWRRAV